MDVAHNDFRKEGHEQPVRRKRWASVCPFGSKDTDLGCLGASPREFVIRVDFPSALGEQFFHFFGFIFIPPFTATDV